MTPEGAIVAACLEFLHYAGVTAWRNNSGAVKYKNASGASRFLRYGKVGSADIIGWMPDGRFLGVECKTTTGRLSEAQKVWLAELRKAGGVAVVARSVDDLIEAMAAEGIGVKRLTGPEVIREAERRAGCEVSALF